jgi:hypothetical protein
VPEKYFGKYTGIVKDNRDEQNLGQLQVSVPAIFPEDALVTARPALPYGVFFVPEPGEKVWVEFEGGDCALAVWSGVQSVPGAWATEAAETPPKLRVIKTAKGHLIILNDKAGEERIEIYSDSRVLIHSLGMVEINAPSVVINGRPVAPLANPI